MDAAACQKNGSSSSRGRGRRAGERRRGGRMLRLGGCCAEVAAQIQLPKPKARKAARELQVAFVRLPDCHKKGRGGGEQWKRRKKRGERLSRGGRRLVGRGCGLDRVQIESRALVAVG